MRFPAPDVGVARFPGPDIRTTHFPGPDTKVVTFPPAPMPVVFIASETVLDFTASTATVILPHYMAMSSLDLTSSAAVQPSTAVTSSTVLDFTSTAIPIISEVTSTSVLDMTSTATTTPVGVVAASSILDLTSTATVTPGVIVASSTTLDFTSTLDIIPAVPLSGSSVLDLSSSATIAAAVVVSTSSTLDILSEGVVTPNGPPKITATGTAGVSGTALVFTLPAADVGDMMVLVAGHYGNQTAVPSGWTLINRRAASSSSGITAFYRIKDGTEASTVTVTLVTSESHAGYSFTVQGGKSINVSAVANSTSTSSTTHTTPAVTTTVDNCLVIRGVYFSEFGSSSSSYTWAAGGGMTVVGTTRGPVNSSYYGTTGTAWKDAVTAGTQAAVVATPPDAGSYSGITFAISR